MISNPLSLSREICVLNCFVIGQCSFGETVGLGGGGGGGYIQDFALRVGGDGSEDAGHTSCISYAYINLVINNAHNQLTTSSLKTHARKRAGLCNRVGVRVYYIYVCVQKQL